MKKKLKILALFDAIAPTTIEPGSDQGVEGQRRLENRGQRPGRADLNYDHSVEQLAIFDDLNLLAQKLDTFKPDIIVTLADQFKNNRSFDQNIVSRLEMRGVTFTGCGSTGLTALQAQGRISKKILGYHSHPCAEFHGHPARQALHLPRAPQAPSPFS